MANRNVQNTGKMERTIDKTKYVVNMYFNPNAKEDAKTKMKRLIESEIRYSFRNECMAS